MPGPYRHTFLPIRFRSKRPDRPILRIVGIASVLAVAAAATISAPAYAVPTVHEITANWADSPAPTNAPYGVTRTAEFHINTNDANDPYANGSVNNVRATLTATNGAFVSIPAVCKTSGVTPTSAITNNGTQLLCNLGIITEGTASVIQAPVKANGAVGSNLSVSGAATSDSATAAAGPAVTPALPITGTRGMDLVISAPNQHFQQSLIASRTGGNRPSIVVDYGIAMTAGSIPGPSTYTFGLNITSSVAGQLPSLQWEGCAPVDDTAQASGIPYSATSKPNRTNAPTCSISGSGSNYTVTLSGLDYSLQKVPTLDSLGNAISSTTNFIAAGKLTFSYATAITQNTGVTFTATPSTFTFSDGVTQSETNTSNNASGTSLVIQGTFSMIWMGGPTAGRSPWDAGLWTAPGSAQDKTFPWPAAGSSTNPGPYTLADQPLGGQADSVTWSTYTGPGGADMAGSCIMVQNPATFTPRWADFLAADGASYSNMTTAHLWYRTDTLNTKTETCGQPVGVAGSPWTSAPLPAGCATQTASISPAYSDDQCIVSLPAGVTAVKMTWNPGVDKQFHHFLRVWGYVPTTAPIGAESWVVGTFNAPYNTATVFPGYPNLNNYVNISTNPNVIATIPGSTYGPNTNGIRDAMRIQGPNGVITKTTPATTASPGVPVTFNLTAESKVAVTSPPNQTFTVVDTLPTGMTYVAGSGTPTPSLSTNGSGQQVLTYTFTNVPANVAQPITYQAQTAPNSAIAPGTVLTNTAVINVAGDNRPVSARQATASVRVPSSGATILGKAVEDNVLSFYGDSSAWNLTISSQDPVSNSFTDTIDVLPRNGDGRGTNIDGTYTITGVTAPAGSTIYYSTAPLASLSNDPRAASNGGTPGSVAGNTVGWSTTPTATPTAIRVIAPALAPGAVQQIRIAFTTPTGSSCDAPAAGDNKPGQVLVNSANSFAGHTRLPMLSSATTTIGDCYALDLKKYVLTKGGDPNTPADFHDANAVADYQQYADGDTVPYRIVVTNKGTGTLTDIPVVDSLMPSCDTTIPSLAPGASVTINCSMTVGVGTTINTASITMTPPAGPTLNPSDPAGVVVPTPYTIAKTSNPAGGTPVAPGSVVQYTITVTEPTSAAPYPSPSFSDSLADVLDDASYNGDVTATAGTATVTGNSLNWSAPQIMSGQVITITYSVTVDSPITGNYSLVNTVVPPSGISCDTACTTEHPVPGVTFTKVADTSVAHPGDVVTYTVTAQNTGQVDYTAGSPASLTDDLTAVLDDATYNTGSATGGATVSGSVLSWSGPLAIGATTSFTYSVTIDSPNTGDDELTNTIVSTTAGSNCADGSTDPLCTSVVRVQSYTVAKTSSVQTVAPGGLVSYSVTVTNTGSVPYTAASPASFTDDLSQVLNGATYNGDASGGATVTGTTLSWSGALPVGASTTITYSVTVNSPATNQTLTNQVAPTADGGSCVSAADCETTTLVGTYTVQKTMSTATTTPGSTVTYTIVVTNTGPVAFTAGNPASFTDSLVGALDDASYPGDATATAGTVSYSAPTLTWSGPLPVGGTQTISYTLVVDNPDSGDHTLSNVVFTPPRVSNCDTGSTDPACSTTTLVQSYRAVKSADTDVAIPGSTITYTVTISNTGQVAYPAGSPATVSDNLSNVLNGADFVAGSLVADTGTATLSGSTITWSGPLAVGETTTFSYQVVVQAGPDPQLLNTITTDASGNCAPGSNDPVCEVLVPTKSYDVVKTASQTTAVPGDTITYTITLTNTGSVAYTSTPGEEASFSDDLSDVLEDADYVAGSLTNGAVLGADDVIRWSGPLPVGGQEIFTFQVTVHDPDTGDHSLENRVQTPPGIGGSCTTDSTDPGCTSVVPVKSYEVSKTVTPTEAQLDERVSYTIVVTNTGQVDYTLADPASLADDLSAVLDDASYNGDVTATSGTVAVAGSGLTWSGALVVGGTVTITYSVTVTGAASGNQRLENAVTPTASGGSCAAPGTCDTEVLVRMLSLVKTASTASTTEGDRVTYTVTLTNTGAVDFTAAAPAAFSDDLSGVLDDASYVDGSATGGGVFTSPVLSWSGIQLTAGSSTTFTYEVIVDSVDTGDHALENRVTSDTAGGGRTRGNCDAGSTDPDCSTVTLVRSLQVEKTVSAAVASPDDTVTYTIVVTNSGAVDYDVTTPASFTDDLTAVIDDATYQNDATATSGAVSYTAPTLSWSGSLSVGGSATITYTVRLIAPAPGDGSMPNRVVTPPGVGGNCGAVSTDPDCLTITLVRAYAVSKVASTTTVLPGGVVAYTITVRNTGQVEYTSAAPASLSDDLSAITDDADYNGDATNGATVVGDTLSWSGPLAVGATVTISYSFTVHNPPDGDGTLTNAVLPTDSSGSCVTTAQCTTETLLQAMEVTKSASQTTALEGDVITYSITVRNIGQVDYANASFTDNLAQVTDDAAFVAGSLTNGATLSSGVISWSGPLPVGATEVITYQVQVDSPDRGDHSLNNTVVTPPGTGSNCESGSTDPDCTTVVPVQSFHIEKQVDVRDFVPGDVVTYTITVTNTGQVDYPAGAPASFTDDLAEVLDDADYQGDVVATGGTVDVTAGVLSWSGALPVGTTVTITYSVQVEDPDTGDKVLTNVVVTPPDSGGNCPDGTTDPQCRSTIPGPFLEVLKQASTTTLLAGGVLTYSVQVTNTGSVDFTDAVPAVVTDDLGDVLDDATYNGDADQGATVSGSTLTWSGPLAIGESITITYSVTARTTGAGDRLLDNAVSTPSDVPSNCSGASTDPDCSTRTPVKAYTTVKSTTASGVLRPGDTVSYQILVTNTGQVDYTLATPARFSDDFSQVLDDATYNDDADSTVGGTIYAAPVLSWTGPLVVGATGTITYSFTVNSTGGDGRLLNAVVSSGTGGSCFSATLGPDCQLTTFVEHDPLASTGIDVRAELVWAIVALGLGMVLVVLSRRRWVIRRGAHRA
jgi:uncharacterized repeat protein (TIGR01451 family)/fimbrial isopeptide formation D2 family protein